VVCGCGCANVVNAVAAANPTTETPITIRRITRNTPPSPFILADILRHVQTLTAEASLPRNQT
jgi:hypothetical protein